MTPKATVLLIDDDGDAVTSLARALKLGHPELRFEGAGTAPRALAVARELRPAVAVVDLVLDPQQGVRSGLELVTALLQHDPTCRVVVLTGHGGVEIGVRALEAGAASFLEKPADIPHLSALIRDGVQQAQLRRAYEARSERASPTIEQLLVGVSPAICQVREQLLHAAKTPQPVLLFGETGTGKGLAAQCIHHSSTRHEQRFVRYQPNFSSSDLTNSDLFGHLKGSFTGAHDDRRGLLAEADGGTFFLDEIDELPLETQVTLLGVLQDRKIRQLGSNKEQPISIKVVCATNRPPEESVAAGKLRKDLYHRIAHVTIVLPPLRERSEDIAVIVQHLLKQLREREQLHVFETDVEALALLRTHSWPGNVRELEAVVQDAAYRAHFAGRASVAEGDLRVQRSASLSAPRNFAEAVEDYKVRLIQEALARCDGNQVKAAQELGLDRSTLRRILARSVSLLGTK